MQNSMKTMMERFFKNRIRRRRLAAAFVALSLLVVTSVSLELMRPVATMTPDLVCEKAEHTHDSSCYESLLTCALQEGEEHTHSAACYSKVLTCAKAEHAHSSVCYAAEAEPVMNREAAAESTDAPQHTDAPENTAETENTAAPEKTEAPENTESPENTQAPEDTEAPQATSTPEATQEPVKLSLSALTGSAQVTIGETTSWTFQAAGAESVSYAIADASGANVAGGTLSNDAHHQISYLATAAGSYTLTVTAKAGDAVETASAAFTVQEAEKLTVSALCAARSCFAGDTVEFNLAMGGGVQPVQCKITVDQSGTVLAEYDAFAETVRAATREVKSVTDVTLTVTLTDAAGATASQSVSIPCAVHDRETASQWEKSARVDLTGVWAEDLLAVAKTQLGYRESDIDFVIREDGSKQGYTRYGDWAGMDYEEWCAMFVSFCLNYADIPEYQFARSSGCDKWIRALKSDGLWQSAKEAPVPGDLIFFDWDGDNASDHVGIVSKVSDDTVYTIEGNSGAMVRNREYRLNDGTIMGYGTLTVAYERCHAVKPTVAPADAVGMTGIVSVESANLRAAATTDSEVSAKLERGDAVEIQSVEQSDEETWYEVTAGEAEGYLRSDLVTIAAQEEILEPAASEAVEALRAEIEALYAREDATEEDAAALEAELTAARDSGKITEEDYQALIALLYPAAATLEETGENGDAVFGTKEGYPNIYTVSLTVKFVPVDENGNVLSNISAYGNTYSTFYSGYVTADGGVMGYSSNDFRNHAGNVGHGLTIDDLYEVHVCGNYRDGSTPFDYIVYKDIPNPTKYHFSINLSNIRAGTNTSEPITTAWKPYMVAYYYAEAESCAVTFNYTNEEGATITAASWTVLQGSPLSDAVDEAGAAMTALPVAPEREGEIFLGWSADEGETFANLDTVITENTTFTAVYAEPAIIEFVYQDSESDEQETLASYTVPMGKTIGEATDENGSTLPSGGLEIRKDGYAYRWDDYDLNDQVVGSEMFVVSERTKLSTVIFQYRTVGDGIDQPTEAAKYFAKPGESLGDAIAACGGQELPSCSLTYPDKYFAGWAQLGEDGALSEIKADNNTLITSDVTFEAVFADKITATFQYSYESEEGTFANVVVATYKMVPGMKLGDVMTELPVAQNVPSGYRLGGEWYRYVAGMIDTATLDTVLEENADFFADLIPQYTVTFVSIDGDAATTLFTYTGDENEPVSTAVDENGNALTALPVPAAPEGAVFAGWYYQDSETTAAQVTPELLAGLVLRQNYTFTAKFSAGCTVTLHVYGVDGVTEETYALQVSAGQTLADVLTGTILTSTHTDAAECNWYTLSGETKTLADKAQMVNGSLDLYTYTYQIVLTLADAETQTASNTLLDYLFPTAYAASVNVNNGTLTITAIAGEKLTPSDFVIDGEDYTLYRWTKPDGTEFELSTLFASGTGMPAESLELQGSPRITDTKKMNMYFYVSVNDQCVEAAKNPVSMMAYWLTGIHGDSYYLSAAQMESIYGKYGYNPDQTGLRVFGHGPANNHNFWTDRESENFSSEGYGWMVPIVNDKNCDGQCWLYYLPKNENVINGGKYENYVSQNTFYTLEVQDSGVVYSASQAEALTKYVLTGNSGEITVSNACKVAGLEDAQVNWKVYDANGSEVSNTAYTSVSDGNNTTTFKFEDISEQYILKPTVELPEGVYSLTYHINLPSNVTIASTRPQIGDGDTYTVYIQQSEDGTYTILSPTLTEFNYNSNKNSLYSYLFKGWMLEESGENVVYTAEQEALISDLIAKDTNNDRTIDLYGLWSDQNQNYSVTFYINMAGQLMTYTTSGYAGGDIIGNAGWCDSVYGTSVSIVEAPTSWPYQGQKGASSSGGNVVIYDVTNTGHSNTDSGKNADSVIRNDLTSSNGVEAYYSGADRTFRIGSVPSDEAALARARSLQATYITSYLSATNNGATQTAKEWAKTVTGHDQNNNPIYGNKILYNSETGAYIPVEDITSDNYTIRWYAFKMEDNGWHVDGALIPKQAKLVVTKTFYGDESMINDVTGDYKVQVTGTAYNKTLKLDESRSSVGNTYTWVLNDVSQGVTYTVKESGYYTEQDQKTTSAEYRVVNPSKKTQVSPGWNQYTADGVSVVASAYSDDDSNYQTVQLLNSYVPAKSMLIRKRDDTGAPLSGVEFTLSKDNGATKLYKDTAGKYHIETIEGATPVNVLTTDSDGVIWLVWPETDTYVGTYTLAETKTPEGYTSVEPFTFSVDASGAVVLGNLPANDAGLVSLNNGVLSVTNRSDVSQVTVKKVWDANVTNREAVTLTLQQNGVSMTGATVNGTPYTITLDGSTVDRHEAIPWQVTWEGLPIYSGGELIRYTVREDSIGSTHYDANADSDGYEDWTVSQTTTVDENHVQIVVTNALALNGVSFKKVDEESNPLPNAVFTLYTNEGCTAVYGTATSGTDGNVVFTNVLPGTYYMKETQVPEGYQENETVYKVSVTGRSITIVDNASTGDVENLTQIQNQKVQKVSITVKKVDQSSNPLDGATFELKKKNEANTYVKVENSGFNDSGNTWTLKDLEAGDYQIVETAAPAGYYKLADNIEFSIAADGTVSLEASEGKWTYNSNTFTLTVTNCAGRELPHTGGVGTVPYTMGGLLILAVGLLYGLGLRRKRERRVRG